jgi:hypothetical protein
MKMLLWHDWTWKRLKKVYENLLLICCAVVMSLIWTILVKLFIIYLTYVCLLNVRMRSCCDEIWKKKISCFLGFILSYPVTSIMIHTFEVQLVYEYIKVCYGRYCVIDDIWPCHFCINEMIINVFSTVDYLNEYCCPQIAAAVLTYGPDISGQQYCIPERRFYLNDFYILFAVCDVLFLCSIGMLLTSW